MTEIIRMVAVAIRRRKFERTGRLGIFDQDLISDEEMGEASAAIEAMPKPTERALATSWIHGHARARGLTFNETDVQGGEGSSLWHQAMDEARALAQIDSIRNEHEALRRRVIALEMIIREDLHPDDCSDDLNRMLVEEIHALKASTPELTPHQRPSPTQEQK
jgi:hypothetical protein